MRITTVQWNIGGGYIRGVNEDPADPLSYQHPSLDSFIELLKKISADIITIQESHSSSAEIQAETISRTLGLPYFFNDVYDKSHIESGQGLSQAIISRFPISNHVFNLFLNPNVEGRSPTGERWLSHEKGITGCTAEIGGKKINIKTSHSFPYRRFEIDPMSPAMEELRKDMAHKMAPKLDLYLYQGDINFDNTSAKPLLPGLFSGGIKEVTLDAPTTPKGRKYDHVIYQGLTHTDSEVISDVLSDHYPVVSRFEIV